MNDVKDTNTDNFWQLQKNQQAIGWDNLLRGKISKEWRKLQHIHKQKKKDIHKQKEKQRKQQDENNRNPEILADLAKKKKKKQPNAKADVFQRVFESITTILQNVWLENNTDQHNLIQGQKQMAKITEAAQTVAGLYSL